MFESFCILVGGGIAIVIVAAVWWFMLGKPAAEARAAQNKFASLGNVNGKTRAEIEAIVGPPKIFSAGEQNQMTCIWQTGGFMISLVFENDICKGVGTLIKV